MVPYLVISYFFQFLLIFYFEAVGIFRFLSASAKALAICLLCPPFFPAALLVWLILSLVISLKINIGVAPKPKLQWSYSYPTPVFPQFPYPYPSHNTMTKMSITFF
jgi:hypothetical protein